jgi:nitrogen regulatory protein P-II 1
MTKLEVVIRPTKFEAVKEVLADLGVHGMTIADVRGQGMQKDHTESYRGHEYSLGLIPKIKIDLVLPDHMVDNVVDAIVRTASTGVIGDGKIFLSRIDQAIRIRNQQVGAAAIAHECLRAKGAPITTLGKNHARRK